MDYLGHSDPLLPPIPKPSLQGWDNYQIYDVVCTDSIFSTYEGGEIVNVTKKERQNFLAVQAYSLKPIECDFQAIVNTYN
ncbi:MAG: hypothetical protein HC778_00550 [Chamaesiphon sp. CSU_1_12]|nr:hypothetical protein [Chamaesiphon sp. CSU_1_12]